MVIVQLRIEYNSHMRLGFRLRLKKKVRSGVQHVYIQAPCIERQGTQYTLKSMGNGLVRFMMFTSE
jgi:hypothetical protein